jgi:hypothetical protein
MNSPRISFGIIVLNGEPFTRYNLRALYPFAHQIIVAEGAGPWAYHMAGPEGHSVDGTLEVLRRFQREEDPEGKVTVVTAEDEGYPDGFWPGEKDEQSQAYAKRATGDWLWQVDIDEFYQPEDMQRVSLYLKSHPDTTCLTFNFYHFWGGFNFRLEGGLLMSRSFAGEPWGACRRVFKWGPGYRYLTHRPPTLVNAEGQDLAQLQKRNLSRQTHLSPIFMFHYSNLFPSQVLPKGQYFAHHGSRAGLSQRHNFESFMQPLDEKKAVRIFDHWGTFNWLKRFPGNHPPTIKALRRDLECGSFELEMRPVDDIERILNSRCYQRKVLFLYLLEILRSYYKQIISFNKVIVRKFITYVANYYLLT